jgi:hypothetical protein
MSKLFEKALRAFDQVNALDPRTQTVQGKSYPRESIFARRVSAWVERLSPEAPEAVRLAARSHTLRRWEIPRNRYSMDTAGYHEWRAATAAHSANAAEAILKQIGYPEEAIGYVTQLITWKRFPQDPNAQLLEDADCLAFLEIKLSEYLEQWEDDKVRRILNGTWRKMTPTARHKALELPLDQRAKNILEGFKQ